MRKLKILQDVLRDSELSSKIYIHMSYSVAGEDYDPYEGNKTEYNLNPICIKGYVRDINPEALVWKQYGLSNIGAKEILCEEKYENYFRKCNKIVIDSVTYQTFKEGAGNKSIIHKRPYKMLRVIITRAS